MTIKVVYASTRGGTAGLAEMMAQALRKHGYDVSVEPVHKVTTVADASAVVVAGALYRQQWHQDAIDFVDRMGEDLRDVPTWLAASGPLDGGAEAGTLPPPDQVTHAAELIGAKGAEVFGGYLPKDAKGEIASQMAKTMAGDWRSPEHVARWASKVSAELRTLGITA